MSKINWLTVISLAASAVLLTILFHESVHGLVCLVLGGDIQQFSAVHVRCPCDEAWKFRVVAGSASIANLLLACGLWPLLRRLQARGGTRMFFVWLLFAMNLFTGTGYWFASGLMNAGDWAGVIRGLEPAGLYRIGLIVLGMVSLMFAVAWTLKEFGRMLEPSETKPIRQSQNLAMTCYGTAFAVMFAVGLAQPNGPFGFPCIHSLMGVLGGLSPLLWMMQWFRADMFKLNGSRPLEIERSTGSLMLAIALFIIAVILTVVGQRMS
jgi:hypothetical protein